jgi:hypothetical protein
MSDTVFDAQKSPLYCVAEHNSFITLETCTQHIFKNSSMKLSETAG